SLSEHSVANIHGRRPGAGPAGTGKIRVKFLVDNEKKKVVFAESGKDFVDVLFSFLTLPLGTIVRLLGKDSSLGCFDELYKSVERLDASHFQTKACKNMLLRPLNAAGKLCENLVIKNLLKQILTSDQPLTDLLFNPTHESTRTVGPISMDVNVSSEDDSSSDSNVIKVKLLVAKINQSIVHAEVGEEFCNLLFSFLTLPLGRVIKLLGGSSSISCIDNLYKTVDLNLNDCISSYESQYMVVCPWLPAFFSCSNSLLPSYEVAPAVSSVACCSPCIRNFSHLVLKEIKCSHGNTKMLAVNPKVPTMTTETGGGYAKGPGKFLVTNELGVVPFSLMNALHELKGKELSISKLETKEFTFTQVEALNLLRAALLSRDALTLAYLATNKPKRRPRHHY
ncbi:hypothetical protein BDA96_06G219000, partial [Sorghum bicolor]